MRLLVRCRAGLLASALLLLFVVRARGDCGMPQVQFGELRNSSQLQNTYSIGTTLTFKCIQGYEYFPGIIPRITCSPASEWEPKDTPFCRGKRCPTPDLENGRFVSAKDLRLGDQITFFCYEGYRIIGRNTANCTLKAGTVDWNYSPYCQRIPCYPPQNIANGLKTGDDMGDYDYGAGVTYWCLPGYSLIGKATIHCRVAKDGVNGEWNSPPPECKVVECPRPEIEHGSISAYQPSYSYDHSLIMSCDDGYYLSGAVLIKCEADNNWHPPIPTCVPGVVPTISDHGSAPGAEATRPPHPGAEPTQPPQPESSKILAIALGCVGGLILVVVIASTLYYKTHQSRGKSLSIGPPDSYHVVPQNTDIALEEKKEPSQV